MQTHIGVKTLREEADIAKAIDAKEADGWEVCGTVPLSTPPGQPETCLILFKREARHGEVAAYKS